MDNETYSEIFLIIISLFISAFLTGAEASFLSVKKSEWENTDKKNSLIDHYLDSLFKNFKLLVFTILIFNSFAKIITIVITVKLALDVSHFYSLSIPVTLLVSTVILVMVFIIFCEIIPKTLSARNPDKYARVASVPLFWLSIFSYPFLKLFNEVSKLTASLFKLGHSKNPKDEFKELTRLSIDESNIPEEKSELISDLVSFRKVTVREVMTPRVDIVAVSVDTNFKELMDIILNSMHSRIPLYKDDLDSVIGIIYTKDLLKYQRNNDEDLTLDLQKIARKVMFVPESKLINDLMREFQAKKMHVAVVVDEFGGTSGLVSLEDILEQIVGDINDEYDNDEEEIKKLSQRSFLVLGKTAITDVMEKLNINLNPGNDEFETIGGFILHHAGFIPDEGYSFIYKNFKFTVKEVENRRVKKIQLDNMQDK
ncbi:MAG: HlyC/CorC family transporter [Ignavibacteriales bacterium]|nr:MAG: HlyC/CorC family transporter [Ignavibacteriales bacterium]